MKSKRIPGFTLLEVMLAVAILGLVGVSLFRFVEGTVAAVEAASEDAGEEEFMEGFGQFLTTQINQLPLRMGAITGEPHRFDGVSGDELRWIATAGPGMLTRYASGEYTIALTTRKLPGKAGYQLGLNRRDLEAREEAIWYPLFDDVYGFEVRYYDNRQQEWVERWADLAVRPTMVRVQLWRAAEEEPYEWTLPVPYVSNEALSPEFNFSRRGQRRRGQGGAPSRGGAQEQRGGRQDRAPRQEQGPGRPGMPERGAPPTQPQRPPTQP